MADDQGASAAQTGLSPSVEPASAVSPADAASIPSAGEPWSEFMQLRAWNDGRRAEVLMLVQRGMSVYRDSVASAQRRYEEDSASLANLMASFIHLSSIIASDAAEVLNAPAQAIEARSGETGTGSIGAADESAVAKPCAQGPEA